MSTFEEREDAMLAGAVRVQERRKRERELAAEAPDARHRRRERMRALKRTLMNYENDRKASQAELDALARLDEDTKSASIPPVYRKMLCDWLAHYRAAWAQSSVREGIWSPPGAPSYHYYHVRVLVPAAANDWRQDVRGFSFDSYTLYKRINDAGHDAIVPTEPNEQLRGIMAQAGITLELNEKVYTLATGLHTELEGGWEYGRTH